MSDHIQADIPKLQEYTGFWKVLLSEGCVVWRPEVKIPLDGICPSTSLTSHAKEIVEEKYPRLVKYIHKVEFHQKFLYGGRDPDSATGICIVLNVELRNEPLDDSDIGTEDTPANG